MSINMATSHERIHYLEMPASDLVMTKVFFSKFFNWQFEDFGDDYVAFRESESSSRVCLEGGFYRSSHFSSVNHGATLIVFYSSNLEETKKKSSTEEEKLLRKLSIFQEVVVSIS